jgi:ankyrin repeat protein
VRNGHYSVAELLIVHGADVNARGYGLPPLIWAVRNDHKELAKLLLDNNAEVDRMGYGLTALHWVSMEGQEAMVRLLLDQGADTTIRTLSEYIASSDKLQIAWCYDFAFLYIFDKNLMAERDLRYLEQ